ncbi:ATP-binding protein [Immundisolibacter sp.]|uniref:ATP-binding protein n=1 Tax=Immundisolibacter sp. TaxID=1934948 RepID=UPI003F833C47
MRRRRGGNAKPAPVGAGQRRFGGLRGRLLKGAAGLLLPVVVALSAIGWLQYQSAKNEVHDEAQRLARERAQQLEYRIDATGRLLAGLLASPSLFQGSAQACGNVLAQLRGNDGGAYRNLAVLDRRGRVQCAAEAVPNAAALRALAGFERALAGGRTQVGGYTSGLSSAGASLAVFVPANADSSLRGLVGHAALDLQWLGERLFHANMPAGAIISVVDHAGNVVLRYPDKEGWIGRSINGTPLAMLTELRGAALLEGEGLDGVQRIHAVVPLVHDRETSGWLRVSIPKRAAYMPLVHQALSTSAGLLLLIVMVAAAWVGLERHVVTPLRDLGVVAHQVAAGERGLRATPRRDDEIGVLSKDFNQMLDNLLSSQKALSLAERRWVMALETAGLGVWDWNVQTDAVFFSHRWKAMLGYQGNDVGGSPARWLALVHPDDRAGCQAARERHLRGETPQYRHEHRVRAADGTWRWMLDQGMVFERQSDGRPLRVVGTYTDVTERKQAEHALLEKQQALAEAQRIAHIGSWSWNPVADIVTCSEETLRLMGIAPSDGPLTLKQFLAPIASEDRRRLVTWCRDGVAGSRLRDIECQVGAPPGARVLNGRAFLQRDVHGRSSALVGTFQDITKRKALEEELDKHRHHLEGLVKSRTAELEAARAEAVHLAQVKTEFLANMSHEIRTPLNAVMGLAQIGVRDSAGRRSHDTFVRIREAGEHLLGVINDILDFSRLEAGRLALDIQPLSLGSLIDNVESLIRERAELKGLRFVTDLPDTLPDWVAGDAQRLRQILVNLLANAVKFTDRGEVSLRVERRGDETLFRVTDTGIGITDEQAARLFRPFEQADTSTTRRYGGSGLGLAISQNLARDMGGEIIVKSALGVGSTFTLRVPLSATAAPVNKASAQREPQTKRLTGLRLLVAEDVEVNRLVLEDLLHQEGAEVTFAEHGRQLLEKLRECGDDYPDAVLMDVQMPVMDGYEATRRVLEMAPSLPVIGLTAHALSEERDRCLAVGMVEHVTKPVDADILVPAILRHTGRQPRPAAAAASSPAGHTGGIDWAALLTRYKGRQDFVTKLAATALDSHRDTPASLRVAAQQTDYGALAFSAHALKGLAGNLLAHEVEKLARQVEKSARAGSAQAVAEADQLAQAVERLLTALADRVGSDGNTEPSPGLVARAR